MSTMTETSRKHSNHIRHSRNDIWVKIIAYTFVGLFGLICLYPLLLTVTVSLTPEDVIASDGYRLFPRTMTLDTYTYILFWSQWSERYAPC